MVAFERSKLAVTVRKIVTSDFSTENVARGGSSLSIPNYHSK